MKLLRFPLLALALLSLSGCLTMTSSNVRDPGGPDMDAARAEAYDGPKARIAVIDFKDSTRNNRYWKASFGRGMKDMLVTALFKTNRFIVLERESIAAIEAERARFGRNPKQRLEDADIMITAAVTEWEPGSAGVRGSTGTGRWFDWSRISGAFEQSSVAIDLRVIDVDTGRVIHATTVEGKANSFSAGAYSWLGGLSSSLGAYAKGPMEQAIREVIKTAVDEVVKATPKTYYRN